MGDNHRFAAGVAELGKAEDVVRELHAGCCQPLRSPRMEALSDTLGSPSPWAISTMTAMRPSR